MSLFFRLTIIFLCCWLKEIVAIETWNQNWTFGYNENFANKSNQELQKFLGSKKLAMTPPSIRNSVSKNRQYFNFPQTFDVRDMWPNCSGIIGMVRDQSECGSCWAAASASAMSDLTCIKCNGEFAPYISDEDLLSCCTECGNCEDGGQVDKAYHYWVKTGVVTGGPYGSKSGCRSYSIPPQRMTCGKQYSTPRCERKCQWSYKANYKRDIRKGATYSWIFGASAMQAQIYESGSIVTNFEIYEDFMRNYRSGVYQCSKDNQFLGYHAAKVIGWSIDKGVPYWLAVNSWSTAWGMNGFFKIRRGKNKCDFESGAIWGVASAGSCFSTNSAISITQSKRSNAVFNLLSLSLIITGYYYQ